MKQSLKQQGKFALSPDLFNIFTETATVEEWHRQLRTN
jgi:hypothetical protein